MLVSGSGSRYTFMGGLSKGQIGTGTKDTLHVECCTLYWLEPHICIHFCGQGSIPILLNHMSNEKKPGCLGYIGDEILPRYVGVIIDNYKDPSQTTSMMESKRVFFRGSRVSRTKSIWNCCIYSSTDNDRWSIYNSKVYRWFFSIRVCAFNTLKVLPLHREKCSKTFETPSWNQLRIFSCTSKAATPTAGWKQIRRH